MVIVFKAVAATAMATIGFVGVGVFATWYFDEKPQVYMKWIIFVLSIGLIVGAVAVTDWSIQ